MELEKDNTLLDWYNKRSGVVKVPVDHLPEGMKPPFSIVDPTIFVDAFFMLNFKQEVEASPNKDFYPDYNTYPFTVVGLMRIFSYRMFFQ